jgi:hypothetical protein
LTIYRNLRPVTRSAPRSLSTPDIYMRLTRCMCAYHTHIHSSPIAPARPRGPGLRPHTPVRPRTIGSLSHLHLCLVKERFLRPAQAQTIPPLQGIACG